MWPSLSEAVFCMASCMEIYIKKTEEIMCPSSTAQDISTLLLVPFTVLCVSSARFRFGRDILFRSELGVVEHESEHAVQEIQTPAEYRARKHGSLILMLPYAQCRQSTATVCCLLPPFSTTPSSRTFIITQLVLGPSPGVVLYCVVSFGRVTSSSDLT